VFKTICNNNTKDQFEEEVQEEDWAEIADVKIPNAKDILNQKYQDVTE